MKKPSLLSFVNSNLTRVPKGTPCSSSKVLYTLSYSRIKLILSVASQKPTFSNQTVSHFLTSPSPLLILWASASCSASSVQKIDRRPSLKMSNRQSGTVKWYHDEKAFGFITPQSGDDLLVDLKDVQTDGVAGLREGQQVSFTVVRAEKGMQAMEVQII